MSQKSRNFCFTINNYTFEDMQTLFQNDASYLCIGFEKGKNNTPHIQGYLHFTTPRHFSSIKHLIPRAHIEMCKGTVQHNIDYCMKDGESYEFGERPEQGKRTDLEDIKDLIQDGVSDRELATKYFSQWCQYRRSFDVYKELVSPNIIPEIVYDYSLTEAVNQFDTEELRDVYVQRYHHDQYRGQPYGIITTGTELCECLTMGVPYYENGRRILFKKIYII